MARYKKFIIVKDLDGKLDLRLGYPIYHEDLIEKEDETNHIKCVGGGYWDLDFENKQIILYGDSMDFGKPKKEDIKKSLESWTKDKWFYFIWTCIRIADIEFPEYNKNTNLEEFTFNIKYYQNYL